MTEVLSMPVDVERRSAPGAPGYLELLAGEATVRVVFQPLIDLRDGTVRGYEALARGPAGSRLATPGALFTAARRLGRLAELDWACRAAAFRGALDGGLQRSLGLFVNAEPEALGVPCPAHLLPVWVEAARRLHLVVELTERDLVADPARLVHVVQELRELGCSIALDDVGAHPDSLTLMPLVEPDVIKLDTALIQRAPADDTARVLHAVAAQAERTGAMVVAEGIETEEHLETALAYGATIGQGWLLAIPQDRLGVTRGTGPAVPARAAALEGLGTPFEEVTTRVGVRHGPVSVVRVMTRQLLETAGQLSSPPVVLCALPLGTEGQQADADLRMLVDLTGTSALLGVAAHRLPHHLPAAVLRGPLAKEDRLAAEWDVVVVGAHFAAAVVARPTRGGWAFALTHDRDTVVSVARGLLARHGARSPLPPALW